MESDPTRIGPPATSSTPRTFTSGSPIARPNTEALAQPHRRLAFHSGDQRTDRADEQPDQAGQARRLQLHVLPEVPNQGAALRGQAELAATSDDHTPLKSEELQSDSL